MAKNITLQFVPYGEIAYLSSFQRVKRLIDLATENKILLIQGKLEPEEEADLIAETMKKIRGSSRFKGIELASFTPKTKNLPFTQTIKENIARALLGSNRDVFTIIGPATLVREIKKDPTKLQLLLRK
ncbi:MAG: OapB/ArvB family protein [Candidatus Pacearchaeota archaeon]